MAKSLVATQLQAAPVAPGAALPAGLCKHPGTVGAQPCCCCQQLVQLGAACGGSLQQWWMHVAAAQTLTVL
jgi:hypothetical protein